MTLLLLACTGPDTSGYPVLTVEGGVGGGAYAPGSEVWVAADVHPQDELVVGWDGADLREWNGTIVMPDADLTLSPRLEDTPVVWDDLDGALVATAEPSVGRVLFFHGARYNRTELQDNAGMTLAGALVRAGWTVVGLDSSAAASSGSGGWTDADIDRVEAWLDAHPADGPVVSMGMSSGGQFAHRFGAALPADAVVAFCAPGDESTLASTTVPTAWMLAERDQTFPTGAVDAAAWSDDLTARGIRNAVYVHPATPLFESRFERIAGIDADTSRSLAEAVRASVAWTDDGWQAFGSAVDLDTSAFDADTAEAIHAEIEIMAADHELYDDSAAAVVAFLADVPDP